MPFFSNGETQVLLKARLKGHVYKYIDITTTTPNRPSRPIRWKFIHDLSKNLIIQLFQKNLAILKYISTLASYLQVEILNSTSHITHPTWHMTVITRTGLSQTWMFGCRIFLTSPEVAKGLQRLIVYYTKFLWCGLSNSDISTTTVDCFYIDADKIFINILK